MRVRVVRVSMENPQIKPPRVTSIWTWTLNRITKRTGYLNRFNEVRDSKEIKGSQFTLTIGDTTEGTVQNLSGFTFVSTVTWHWIFSDQCVVPKRSVPDEYRTSVPLSGPREDHGPSTRLHERLNDGPSRKRTVVGVRKRVSIKQVRALRERENSLCISLLSRLLDVSSRLHELGSRSGPRTHNLSYLFKSHLDPFCSFTYNYQRGRT